MNVDNYMKDRILIKNIPVIKSDSKKRPIKNVEYFCNYIFLVILYRLKFYYC